MTTPEFSWGRDRWLALAPNLRRPDAGWLDSAPDGWSGLGSTPLSEEAMVTVLLLHLGAVARADALVPYGRSGSYWGEADLLARDPLGRIHLFECKTGTFDESDADQMAVYALGTLFADAREHLAYRLHRRHGDMLGMQLAKYMAATLTNVSVYTLPKESVRRHARPFTGEAADAASSESTWERFWNRLPDADRDPLRLRALRNRAVARGWPDEAVPPPEVLLALAERWATDLPEPPEALFSPERPAALWFVAPRFAGSVAARVRRFRGEGVDVRLLEFETRVNPAKAQVMVRVREELLPQRDLVLQRAIAWGQNRDAAERLGGGSSGLPPRQLRLTLYHRRSASDRTVRELHGSAVVPTEAKAELVDWKDRRVQIADGVAEPSGTPTNTST